MRWAERGAATVPALMEAVRAELAAQGIHPPYRLLGMSLGAMACVAWAEMYADEVEMMVLVLLTYLALMAVLAAGLARLERRLRLPGVSL